MTTPSLPDALRACIELGAQNPPGDLMLATSCSWRRILVGPLQLPFLVPSIDSDRHPNLECGAQFAHAEESIACTNLIRQHGPALEALLRDAELWRRANGTFVSGEEEVRCHVLIGVNEWKSGEWRAFHQVTPEEFAETLALMPGFVLAGPKP